MLRVGILVSGGGTNLQAILDRMDDGHLTNVSVEVVISNNRNAYALERARNHGIRAVAISPKEFETREAFNEAFLAKVVQAGPDRAGRFPRNDSGGYDQEI